MDEEKKENIEKAFALLGLSLERLEEAAAREVKTKWKILPVSANCKTSMLVWGGMHTKLAQQKNITCGSLEDVEDAILRK